MTRSPTSSLAPAAGLAGRFHAVRLRTEAIAAPLSPEEAVVQSMPDASPVKWHLAHTSWFFETFVLEPAYPGYRRFHEAYAVLFNSYYNSVGAQHPRPQRGLLVRPPLHEVLAYRAHVTRHVRDLLDEYEEAAAPWLGVIETGIQHEQQHQELMCTDLKHLFGSTPLQPAYHDRAAGGGDRPSPLRWLPFGGGASRIGFGGDGFAFDNERPRHAVQLAPFELSDRCISNAEYLAFIDDGGYRTPEWWLSDGWDAVRAGGWRAPLYWRETPHGWRHYTLAGERGLRADGAEPVTHLSYYEADAFARWSGARLPTEAEWETAAAAADRESDGAFAESGRWQPAPARGGSGLRQMFGDVWEWTASAYQPYPGYRAAAGALGEYNGKFMVNQQVLRGGSCATPRSHVRATYRNFFPPAKRWQFSGLRLARDA